MHATTGQQTVKQLNYNYVVYKFELSTLSMQVVFLLSQYLYTSYLAVIQFLDPFPVAVKGGVSRTRNSGRGGGGGA